MDDTPDIVLVGIAFVFGSVVPAGGLYLITAVPPFGVGDELLSLVLPLVWFAVITLGATILGNGLEIPTDALLGGGTFGTFFGFMVFATLVGWSFVVFAIVPIAILALIAGAWIAYEWNRRTDAAEEPRYGTWRSVFVLAVLAVAAIPVVLLVV